MRAKDFDAVEMKRRAQQQVAERFGGKPAFERIEELRRWREESQDEMAVLWRERWRDQKHPA